MADHDHRLLVFAPVPASVAEEIAWLRGSHGVTAKPVHARRLHNTLAWLGDHRVNPAELIERTASVLSEGMPAAGRIVFDRLVSRTGPVRLVPSEPPKGVQRVQQQLLASLAAAGIRPPPRWRGNPHVTVAHGPSPPFKAEVDPISWTIDEVRLVLSHVGRTRHETIASWRLAPASPGPAGAAFA